MIESVAAASLTTLSYGIDEATMEFFGKRWTSKKVLAKIAGQRIDELDLQQTRVDDKLLAAIAEQGTLTSLTISSDAYTDAGIQAVVKSCPLRSLMIFDGRQITDDVLPDIASCQTLRELYLESTAITDERVELIGKLPLLWSLNISHTAITDAGIAKIASKNINLVSFEECNITGRGFSMWENREKFSFYTDGAPVDDEGFAVVCRSFSFLWNIIVENTCITDAGLKALAGQQPTSIRIRNSPITREGVIWLIENTPVQGIEVDPGQFTKEDAVRYENYEGRYLSVRVY